MVLKLKDLIAERAKERQKEHAGTAPGKPKTLLQNSVEVIDTQKELAHQAGVSHDTIHKVQKIQSQAIDEIKDKARSGQISIHEPKDKFIHKYIIVFRFI